ncbi:MAG TPA: hypothetical protein VEN29_01920 [Casimicrobiaceae bacterium]|nr:hypothetical protein [Casimicrobiaceae bacterium]
MHSDTSTGLRVAALLGAGSITASILLGVALLAQPVMPVADQPVGQELAAMAAAAGSGAPERLRITVVGTRDPSLASTTTVVGAQADCPPDAAHSRYTGAAASPATRPSKV